MEAVSERQTISSLQDPDPVRSVGSPPIVDIRDLSFSYAGTPPTTVLRNVSMHVNAGEYVSLMGPSGSGKSTLLNVLGLLDAAPFGRYLLDGHDTGTLSDGDRAALRGQNIGFIFQSFHLLPYRTARENVELAMLYGKVNRVHRRQRADAILEAVGLGHRKDSLPSAMSGGERQRVAIARAIVNEPQLLLCDEPTGNLDSQTASSIMSLLDELHRGGHTILMITHDNEIAARADRYLAIRDGVVTESFGRPDSNGII